MAVDFEIGIKLYIPSTEAEVFDGNGEIEPTDDELSELENEFSATEEGGLNEIVFTSNSLNLYLQEIDQYPLLKRDQEINLAKMLAKGKKAEKYLSKHRDLEESSKDQYLKEQELGELARKRLYESNLRLVVNIARKFVGRSLPLLDLIGEGNIGLGKGIDRFKVEKGFKLSTYASWWIRQSINLGLVNAKPISFSFHGAEIASKAYKTSSSLAQKLGREPTVDELAKTINVATKTLETVVKSNQHPLSLETPIGENGDDNLHSVIEGNSLDPVKATLSTFLSKYVEQVLDCLNDRERQVIIHRFGLFGERPKTLEETGVIVGVKRQRIKQNEDDALAKLLVTSQKLGLHDFLED